MIAQRPPGSDGQEQQHEVAGDTGATEQPRALARPRCRLLGLGLGQLDLLPDQIGEVLADLAEQAAQTRVERQGRSWWAGCVAHCSSNAG